jgi:hypothetical protein
MSLAGSQLTERFSGMQKRQAKLHLSVTEILSFSAALPFLSISLPGWSSVEGSASIRQKPVLLTIKASVGRFR